MDRNVTIKSSGAQPEGLGLFSDVGSHEQASPVAVNRCTLRFGRSNRSKRCKRSRRFERLELLERFELQLTRGLLIGPLAGCGSALLIMAARRFPWTN